ncbi:GNAT family N-acetyltransferase [Pseudonocardia sp. H11422]|uniref:GNAT family N-acetyltransferase n=1 Tax=Pseudonocardia sp. H11422 TaxID=2835866 RepID=UPI001BDD9480|nr:GNAT family N-acetyltransferase [Pseudonocardia sp. H11422]
MTTTSTDLRIRTATIADWPAIWPIWRRVVGAGETYVWDPATDEPTARSLWMAPHPAVVFVAERTDPPSGPRVVGTALLKPVQPGLGAHVANAGFMVDPDAAGGGVGRRLAEHVLDEARRSGYRAMQFNAVVEVNTRAVGLWRSLGFEVIGTVPRAFRHPTAGTVGLHIMHREL